MKKIIALALALIMVLSMGVVALADADYAPGEKILAFEGKQKREWKVSYDFTSAKVDGEVTDYRGISMIDSIDWEKQEDGSYNLYIYLKENLTSITEKELNGIVTLTSKTEYEVVDGKKVYETETFATDVTVVGNAVAYIDGAKKAAEATDLTDAEMAENVVMYAEEGAGYFTFTDGFALTGLVKVEDGEKAQVYFADIDEDTEDAIEAYLGEDYEAIVEKYNFAGTGFKADVDFTYDAYAEDPHFFYAWDGEKFVEIEAKFNDDEDVDAYEFTAAAKGIIIVTDVEIVADAADTKNPDTGANDVVGVAAALAVVSLVAAGAVSLKK